MNLILFGFKGCGKTHFGKLLAQRMRRPFIDTDDLLTELYVEKTYKHLPPRKIFEELGETEFRQLEKEALEKLEEVENSIIALGGGAVLDPDNVAYLEKLGQLVYLQIGPEILRKRQLLNDIPAFLDKDDPLQSFQKTYQERKVIYESIPARKVDLEILDEAGVLAALSNILILEEPHLEF